MNIAACLTSKNEHYCSPPTILDPTHRLLVPRGSGRRLIDPASNPASQVLAELVACGDDVDGLACDWSEADCFYTNPPYGKKIAAFAERQHYWGRTRGLPGVSLLPARDDTDWCQRHVFGSADAWLHVRGRLSFLLPIPLAKADAVDDYFLRRWFEWAEDDRLPDGFSLLAPGYAIGPELGANGKPQAAPFPSLVAFWADHEQADRDPLDEIHAMRELVRAAAPRMRLMSECLAEQEENTSSVDAWLDYAEGLLGPKRVRDKSDIDLGPFDRLELAEEERAPQKYPLTVREFARHFMRLGTLTVARGPLRGVWRTS